MLSKILILILITLLPFLELRLSIPLGMLKGKINLPFGLTIQGLGMPWLIVFIICVSTNILLGPMVYLFLDKAMHLFLKNKIIDKYYNKYITRTQRKIHPYIEKYGLWGLAFFIAWPIPGSGSYSGAVAAYVLGIKFKKFMIANMIGVIIAGIIVTLIVSSGGWLFNLLF